MEVKRKLQEVVPTTEIKTKRNEETIVDLSTKLASCTNGVTCEIVVMNMGGEVLDSDCYEIVEFSPETRILTIKFTKIGSYKLDVVVKLGDIEVQRVPVNFVVGEIPEVTNGMNQTMLCVEDDAEFKLMENIKITSPEEEITTTLTLSDSKAGEIVLNSDFQIQNSTTSNFDAETGVLTVIGTPANVTDVLKNTEFSLAENYNGNSFINFEVSNGNGTQPWFHSETTVSVTAVNDAPFVVNDNDTIALTRRVGESINESFLDLFGDVDNKQSELACETKGYLPENVTMFPNCTLSGVVLESGESLFGVRACDAGVLCSDYVDGNFTALPSSSSGEESDEQLGALIGGAVLLALVGFLGAWAYKSKGFCNFFRNLFNSGNPARNNEQTGNEAIELQVMDGGRGVTLGDKPEVSLREGGTMTSSESKGSEPEALREGDSIEDSMTRDPKSLVISFSESKGSEKRKEDIVPSHRQSETKLHIHNSPIQKPMEAPSQVSSQAFEEKELPNPNPNLTIHTQEDEELSEWIAFANSRGNSDGITTPKPQYYSGAEKNW